jgi:hypothetical protein
MAALLLEWEESGVPVKRNKAAKRTFSKRQSRVEKRSCKKPELPRNEQTITGDATDSQEGSLARVRHSCLSDGLGNGVAEGAHPWRDEEFT